MAKSAGWFPAWVKTVQASIDEQIEIRAWCDAGCRKDIVVVDLERIKAAKGPDYSLINKRTRCKTPGCKGWVKFHYPSGVYRPLFDFETAVKWMVKDRRRLRESADSGR